MQDDFSKKAMGACVVCGKPVPRRDVRDNKPSYCGRVHAGLAKFSTRYSGSNSGPMDRPVDLIEKTKWKA
jgi:hypothetical protein